MDTPTYTGSATIGGTNQGILLSKGSVLPNFLITRQSGSLILTAYGADGTTAFDLSSVTSLDCKVKPYESAEVAVTLGTGTISGAGNNIYTVSWVKDKIPAGWSSYAQDRDGAIVLWVEFEETGTADFYQVGTRFNVEDGSFTGSGATQPLVSLIYYYLSAYEYDNTTTDADPTASKYRMDSTTLASVTEIYISDTDKQGVDQQTYYQALTVGSHIKIGNPNVKLESAYFTVSGTPVNNTNYTTIPVTFVSAGTTQFTNGSTFALLLDSAGLSNSFADDSSLKDDNGNELVQFGVAASAVNHLKFSNAATGNPATIEAVGGDTNASLNIKSQAAGTINLIDATVLSDTLTLGGALLSNSQQIQESKGADVASATALALGTDGNSFDVTGTTAITSINTIAIGTVVTLHFDGILTLTHHATDLILPTAANITTAAGDIAIFTEYASGDWRCISYTRADGTALAATVGTSLPTTKQTAITTTYSTDSDDVGKIVNVGSATAADFVITHDTSLLSDSTEFITFVNQSSYDCVINASTGSQFFSSQESDIYLNIGQSVVLQGDTSTNNIIFSKTG